MYSSQIKRQLMDMPRYPKSHGCLNSLDWNGGMEWWNGLVEWTGMVEWNGGMNWNSGMEGWWVPAQCP